jgi:hypothetical protein
MQNLDTHILIHAIGGLLTQAERDVLAGDDWGIPKSKCSMLESASGLGWTTRHSQRS